MDEERLIGCKVVGVELGRGSFTRVNDEWVTDAYLEFEGGIRLYAYACGCCDGIGWELKKLPKGDEPEQSI